MTRPTKLAALWQWLLDVAWIVLIIVALVSLSILVAMQGAKAAGPPSLIGQPFAFQKCGGGAPDNSYPAGNALALYPGGVKGYAEKYADLCFKQGYRRFWWEKPGGLFALNATNKGDTRDVHINQWQLAQQAGFAYANDDDLKAGIDKFRLAGVLEHCFYLGGPDSLADPYEDGLKCLEPFIRCGPPEHISFGFDLLGSDEKDPGDLKRFRSPWHKQRCVMLVAELARRGHHVYLEARPSERRTEWLGIITGTHSAIWVDKQRPAELKTAGMFGEITCITDHGDDKQIKEMPTGATVIMQNWGKVKASEVKAGK